MRLARAQTIVLVTSAMGCFGCASGDGVSIRGGDGAAQPDASAWMDAGSFDAGWSGADASVDTDAAAGVDAATVDAGMRECAPGAREDAPCGACASGVRTRSCSAGGTWGSWSGCSGELQFPVAVGTTTPVCPPYDRPAVFFSPHPDDETLGMGGAIAEHVAAGRDVFVELMTDGRSTGVIGVLDNGGTHAWHAGRHEYSLTRDQIGAARVAEFLAATAELGVTGVYVSAFTDGALTVANVNTRIQFWRSQGAVGLSLKGTAREPSSSESPAPHPDHAAVWDALLAYGGDDVRGYLVYKHGGTDAAYSSRPSITTWCATKRRALEAYGRWAPASGRYAIGHHSTRALFMAAHDHCYEYVVLP